MSKDKRVPFGIYAPDGSKLKSYNTEQDVKSDINLISNQVAQIIGKTTVNDGLGYTAIIESTNKNGIPLDNGLFANPIPNTNGSEKVDKTIYESDKQGLENKVDSNMGTKQDGVFPLTQAEVGKTYRAGNGKLYKCITAYSGTEITLPNDNFRELSIVENSSRLDNLFILGGDLSSEDDLNQKSLYKGIITTYSISGQIPKNAPSGASVNGIVICIKANRYIQLYIDRAFSIKSRMSYASTISEWL